MNPNILFQALLSTLEMEKEKLATKFSVKKVTHLSYSNQSNVALSDSKLLLRNLFASSLVLALSLLLIGMILFSLFTRINIPQVTGLYGLLLIGLVIATPGTWFIQSFMNYRRARELGRLGLMTKGIILDKWVRETNGKLAYHVRYQYLGCLNGIQIVDKETFAQLRRKGNVFVLYLENLPHISRLDLD